MHNVMNMHQSQAGEYIHTNLSLCPIVVALSLRSLELIKWTAEHGCQQGFRLVDKVSSKWQTFGRRVKIEHNKLKALEDQYRDPARCWLEVMEHWLNGGGNREYPVTWDGLYALLEDVEFSEVAKELKKAVSSPATHPLASVPR